MSKLGLHVAPGSRDNYGPLCVSKPAVVVAVNEGGALEEVRIKSGGHTLTIFRDTTVYLQVPPEWNEPGQGMAALARSYYPRLKAKWLQNPANYYQLTNEESGGEGDDVRANLIKLVAYERELMRLANLDGLKVCVLSLAGGSPGDFDLWTELCVPFIRDAFLAGNLYGRHAYGEGDLIDQEGNVIVGNPSRPLEESAYLYHNDIIGGLVITELGLDGGMGWSGIDRFCSQLEAYERIIRDDPLIVGAAAWTVGDWQGANCQSALPRMTQYNNNNPTDPWQPPEPVEQSCFDPVKEIIMLVPPTLTGEQRVVLADWAYNGIPDYTRGTSSRHTYSHSHVTAIRTVLAGLPTSELYIVDGHLIGTGLDPAWLRANCPLIMDTRKVVWVTTEEPEGSPIPAPLISQRDPRWGNVIMGTTPGGEVKLIKNWGCLLVVYTSLANYWGLCPDTPDQFLTRMQDAGAMSGPFILPAALATTFPSQVEYLGFESRGESLNERIRTNVDNAIPVPIRVDFNPATGQFEQHWCLVVDYTANDFIIMDPWHGDIILLSSRYGSLGPLEGVFYKRKDYQPPYQYNGPAVTFQAALHAPGSDWEWQKPEVQSLFSQLRIPVKWMSNGISADFYPAFNRPEFHIIRVFWKPSRKKTPAEAWTEDIRDGVMAFYNRGGRRFELLNEPNLPEEGWGVVWTNATELAEWLIGMTNIIKANCPGAKVYFPGMSPGSPWTNQFAITDQAWPLVKGVMDGFCLHAYTGTADNATAAASDIASQVIQTQEYLRLQVPLVLSEASVNRPAPPQYKAQVYLLTEARLVNKPGVEAVCWFISSWSDSPDTNQESWVKYGIGTYYGV